MELNQRKGGRDEKDKDGKHTDNEAPLIGRNGHLHEHGRQKKQGCGSVVFQFLLCILAIFGVAGLIFAIIFSFVKSLFPTATNIKLSFFE